MAEVNFENRTLYHGDNLDFLRGMNSETVHLIATDPPFNKSRDFHATPDSLARGARFSDRWSWERDVHEEWTDSIEDDWPAVWSVIEAARLSFGDDMGAFLCWLGVRLMEMHRVLRLDGSFYLHIDHTAHAYVKALLDGIFGHKNFRNEIVWCYAGGGIPKRDFPRKHDTILRYTKTDAYHYQPVYRPYSPGTVQRGRTQIKGKYFERGLRKEGTPVNDWWTDVPKITSPTDPEKIGFPTQKPIALYERIISVSSDEGDIVLDPFAGCATTPIAAERIGRKWVGMDIWDGAYQTVLTRLENEGLAVENADHEQPHLMTFGDVHYLTTPPERTDDNEVAAPSFRLKMQRPVEPWQRITHRGMVNILVQAQGSVNGVICGGCGRGLEREFMELDHITPKSDRGANDISNRILLCRPCNGRKRDNLTLRGLIRENKRIGWMKGEDIAEIAQSKATDKAEWVRDNYATEECRALIEGKVVL